MADRRADLVEYAEAESYYQTRATASAAVREQLGIAVARLGGGVVMATSNDPVGRWSRVTGFTEPVTAELVGQAIEFFRAHGASQAVVVVPSTRLPADWDEICRRFGLTHGGSSLKLVRDAAPAKPVETSLRIGEVGPEDAHRWAQVQLRALDMPDGGMGGLWAGMVAQDNIRAYAAWDGDELVATASILRHGEVAQFGGAATLPEYRGRGAQSALLTTRINDAVETGIRAFSVETAKPAPGEENKSLENLRRIGFEVLYERPNWIWRRTD